MQKYLKRNAYDRLLKWKERPDHSTLEVSGARQVGKTYIVNKFADEQYKRKIYINLLDFTGELFLEKYEELRNEIKNGFRCDNPVYELIRRVHPEFEDTSDTIVIIDEIQESAAIYNRIREFTRQLKSDFIITGSYLGRILNREFKYSAGDLDSLEIHTLDFREFLMALDKEDLYQELDLYGESSEEVYKNLADLYKIYTKIGGYPAVILRYLESGSVEEANTELLKIIKLFTNESKRYFDDILDDEVYDNIFSSVARVLVKEKKGFDEDSFSEELQNIVVKDYSSNISKASVNRAIDWLYSSGIIGFAGKIKDCNILDFKPKARCYFMDIGLTSYFLTHIGCSESDVSGIVNENFVFLDLKRRIVPPGEIALETPAFATMGRGEIDFYLKSLRTRKTYAIDVKTGKNQSKTVQDILDKRKADYVVYAKGNTHGGVRDNIYTIPIYGIGKFEF
ncbi:MAG TPA: AAA family ATPase [Candidatus Mediterraneibacter avicola]|nr:AAA family ATPase [Candidatus Mediterraneibacter avicola]